MERAGEPGSGPLCPGLISEAADSEEGMIRGGLIITQECAVMKPEHQTESGFVSQTGQNTDAPSAPTRWATEARSSRKTGARPLVLNAGLLVCQGQNKSVIKV